MKKNGKIKKWGKQGGTLASLKRFWGQFESIDEFCDSAEKSERKRLARSKPAKPTRKAA